MLCYCFLILNMSKFYIWVIKVSKIGLMHSNEGRTTLYNSNILVNQLICLWLTIKKWRIRQEWGQIVLTQLGFGWGLVITIKKISACYFLSKNRSLFLFYFFAWKPEQIAVPDCKGYIWGWLNLNLSPHLFGTVLSFSASHILLFPNFLRKK